MSTPTAAIIKSKSEQATQLSAKVQTLGQEVAKLRERLENAQHALGSLQEKRRKLTEDAAYGKHLKPSEIADLTAALDQAQIPADGLTALLSTKQRQLDAANATLRILERELALEAEQEARHAHFDSLKSRGGEIVARVAEKLRALIEVDLVEIRPSAR